MSITRGVKIATLTNLPGDVQQAIYLNLPPHQIASLITLSTSIIPIIRDPSLWALISQRTLRKIPDVPSLESVHALAHSLVCRWWLLTGLFVTGVPVHRRSGFCEVAARGGVELPIVHDERQSCYVFGGRHEAAAVPVVTPSVSACFFLEDGGPFPVDGMRIAIVHTVETEHEEDDETQGLSFLNLGPAATSDPIEEIVPKCEEQFAAVTVRVNNQVLLSSFRPKHGNFQVTHIHVPADVLVTKPRMNHISVEYDRSSTAAYWLRDISIMPSILPPPPEETAVTATRIGEPLPQPTPDRPAVSQPASPSSAARGTHNQHGHGNNATHGHRRHVRRLTDHSFKQHVNEAHAAARYQKAHIVNTKAKHMYHHNYFRSPRRSSPSSPKARSGR